MVGLKYAQPLYSIIMGVIRELGSNTFITWINENFIYEEGVYLSKDEQDTYEYTIIDLRDIFPGDLDETPW